MLRQKPRHIISVTVLQMTCNEKDRVTGHTKHSSTNLQAFIGYKKKKEKKSFFTEYTEHSSKVAQLQSVSSKIKPLTAEEEEEEEEKSQTSAPGQKEES